MLTLIAALYVLVPALLALAAWSVAAWCPVRIVECGVDDLDPVAPMPSFLACVSAPRPIVRAPLAFAVGCLS